MKRILFLVFSLIALAACTPESETAVAPPLLPATVLPTATTVPPTATAQPIATAVQPTATAIANEGTTTPLVSVALAEQMAVPLPVQQEITFIVAAQQGGTFNAVAIDDNTVYLGIGPRLATVDISDPAAPRLLWQSDVLPDVVGAIAVQPDRAYLRVGAELLIFDISDPALPVMVGAMNGVSGDLFPVGAFVYALAAGVSGVANQPLIAIDVSDPSRPILDGTRNLTSPARIAASEELLYIASGGPFDDSDESTLQLVDRSDLGRTYSEFALQGDWGHRVAIVGEMAYIIEDRLSEDPDVLLALDVSDPTNPKEITAWQFVIEHSISAILAADETLLLLGRSFPHTGCPTLLYVVDITDPASPRGPVEIDPQSCFNHFALAGDILVATSERGLQIFDISDPTTLALTGELAPQDGFISVERIGLDQGLAYLLTTAGRNRLHRLRVLDVTGATPTLLNGDGLALEIEPSIFEGLDFRGDRLFGLGPHAVDVTDPRNPRLAINDLAQENAAGVYYWPSPARVDNVLFTGLLSATPGGLMTGVGVGVVDISDAANPVLVGTLSLEGSMVTGLSTAEGYLIVFSQKEYAQTQESTVFLTLMQIFDVSDPLAPVEVGRLEPAIDLPERFREFTIASDTVYATGVRHGDENEYKLYALDISEPTQPNEIGRFELSGDVTKMVAVGDALYVRLSDGRLWALNIGDRAHPYLSGTFGFNVLDFDFDADLVYLAAGDAGLYVVQVEE